MKLCLMSDLHGNLPDVAENDLTIISGDICPDIPGGAAAQLQWVDQILLPYLDRIPAKEIAFIWGNHDFVGEKYTQILQSVLKGSSIMLLKNESVTTIAGLKLWGTPYSLSPERWAFRASEQELDDMLRYCPEDVDILISHGPPAGVRDLTVFGEHLGSESLRYRIQDLRPKLVVCGHIHEDSGVGTVGSSVVHNVALAQFDWRATPKFPTYLHWPTLNEIQAKVTEADADTTPKAA